jgi:hypothetical protein
VLGASGELGDAEAAAAADGFTAVESVLLVWALAAGAEEADDGLAPLSVDWLQPMAQGVLKAGVDFKGIREACERKTNARKHKRGDAMIQENLEDDVS